MWEFPKIRGTLFWGPYNKDPTILGSPIFGNSHYVSGDNLAFVFSGHGLSASLARRSPGSGKRNTLTFRGTRVLNSGLMGVPYYNILQL